mmetsp:Transcript_26465/g.69610  ORF Transcript_26465/g.69610 Transcript_26465/m.69610 type:complete len:228 (-) Transcript_26465:246-929(-)
MPVGVVTRGGLIHRSYVLLELVHAVTQKVMARVMPCLRRLSMLFELGANVPLHLAGGVDDTDGGECLQPGLPDPRVMTAGVADQSNHLNALKQRVEVAVLTRRKHLHTDSWDLRVGVKVLVLFHDDVHGIGDGQLLTVVERRAGAAVVQHALQPLEHGLEPAWTCRPHDAGAIHSRSPPRPSGPRVILRGFSEADLFPFLPRSRPVRRHRHHAHQPRHGMCLTATLL